MTKYIDIHTHNPRADVLSPTMAGIHPWQAERVTELPDFSQCDIYVIETCNKCKTPLL